MKQIMEMKIELNNLFYSYYLKLKKLLKYLKLLKLEIIDQSLKNKIEGHKN